jgi:hypothetical protein
VVDAGIGQYYVEAADMWTKDHLRLVLLEEKRFLKRSELRTIEVPPYDELSVRSLYPGLETNKEFMKFMPNKLAKGKYVSRTYFFNVLYTLYPDHVTKMVAHAQKQRFASGNAENHMDEVKVSGKMWDELNAMPYFSRKYLCARFTQLSFRAQGQDPAPAQGLVQAGLLRPQAQAVRGLRPRERRPAGPPATAAAEHQAGGGAAAERGLDRHHREGRQVGPEKAPAGARRRGEKMSAGS